MCFKIPINSTRQGTSQDVVHSGARLVLDGLDGIQRNVGEEDNFTICIEFVGTWLLKVVLVYRIDYLVKFFLFLISSRYLTLNLWFESDNMNMDWDLKKWMGIAAINPSFLKKESRGRLCFVFSHWNCLPSASENIEWASWIIEIPSPMEWWVSKMMTQRQSRLIGWTLTPSSFISRWTGEAASWFSKMWIFHSGFCMFHSLNAMDSKYSMSVGVDFLPVLLLLLADLMLARIKFSPASKPSHCCHSQTEGFLVGVGTEEKR